MTYSLDLYSKGGKAFLKALLPRLNPKNINGGPAMPFELEVWYDFYVVSLYPYVNSIGLDFLEYLYVILVEAITKL